MLFPALSVTLLGLIVGGFVAATSDRGVRPLLLAFIGAWAGFILGALVGVGIDATTGSGVWVAIVGHVAAIPVAFIASRRTTRDA